MSAHLVTITTAQKLTAAQRAAVIDQLSHKLGDVKLVEQVNPDVLGGMQIAIGSHVFDATLSGKLSRLEAQIPEVIVTSAVELSTAQLKKIQSAFEKKLGSVAITTTIDESVIGGVKFQYGSKELDGTVQGKLKQLKTQLLASV